MEAPEFSAPEFSVPKFSAIEDAAARISTQALVTPLLENPLLNERVGARVLLKAENLQRTGSFKFRGAFNRISLIPEDQRKAGVVAYSSGNHAQGVAAAARVLGLPAAIVMPDDAPAIKIANTRGYGAEVVFCDRHRDSREAIAEALAAERGAVLVRPFDDPAIIAGQGTCGREIALQAKERGLSLDAALICCGGGGLVSGCSLALRTLSPATEVYAVEPAGFDDTTRSLVSGRRERNDPAARSICDALLAPTPGELTFKLNRELLAGGLVVSDAEVRDAMRFAVQALKLVIEPGGAVALTALLAGKLDVAGKTVAVVISGGNVDPALLAQILGEDQDQLR